jgi:hypothetical protein
MLSHKKISTLMRTVLIVLLIFPHLHAVAQSTSCGKAQVFFVNGVWNDKGYDAMEAATELTATINEALDARGLQKIVNVRTIWNEGDGYVADLAEVALAQPLLSEALRAIFQGFSDAPAATARRRKSIDKVKEIVLREIRDNGSPVVLVAHSQGNIIVNAAVSELQETWGPTVPQVMNIAIVGIAVADRNKVGRFYSYITSATDKIIFGLIGVPSANFQRTGTNWIEQAFWLAVQPLKTLYDIIGTEHPLVTTYLNASYQGSYQGSGQTKSSRQIVGELFVNAYENATASWPCVSITSTPNPSKLGELTTFQVAVKARPGDTRKPTGSVIATKPANSNQARLDYCIGELDFQGRTTCTFVFSGEPRTETVAAIYEPTIASAFQVTSSAPYQHVITTGLYVGNVSISGPASIPQCAGTMSVLGSASLSLVEPPSMTLTVNEVISLSCSSLFTTPGVISIPLIRSGTNLSGVVRNQFTCGAPCVSGVSSYFVTLQIDSSNPAFAITGSLQHTNTNQTPFTANASGPISFSINQP